jgi:hypothetical protein
MVKVVLWDDLHLEFHTQVPTWKNPGGDVLLLAGDICLAEHLYMNPGAGIDSMIQKGFYAANAILYRRFFDHVSKEFPHVIYVMGNHEHYNSRWDRTEQVLRDECARYPNITLLEQQKLVIDDVVFLGATIWTDFNNHDPLTEFTVRDCMNDYRLIEEKNGAKYHKLRTATTLATHTQTVKWLDMMLSEDKRKTVVVGHHAPSKLSINAKYQNQSLMNGAYVSSLEHLMMDRDHLKLWVHGHLHDKVDYTVFDTRVISNPHGYPHEIGNSVYDSGLILDV